jgi:hypothetical protein
VPYVNGISVASKDLSFAVQAGALHPNARGEAYLAASVIPKIRAAFPATTPKPTALPTRRPPLPPEPTPNSPIPWFFSLALIVLVFAGAAIVIARRRKAE